MTRRRRRGGYPGPARSLPPTVHQRPTPRPRHALPDAGAVGMFHTTTTTGATTMGPTTRRDAVHRAHRACARAAAAIRALDPDDARDVVTHTVDPDDLEAVAAGLGVLRSALDVPLRAHADRRRTRRRRGGGQHVMHTWTDRDDTPRLSGAQAVALAYALVLLLVVAAVLADAVYAAGRPAPHGDRTPDVGRLAPVQASPPPCTHGTPMRHVDGGTMYVTVCPAGVSPPHAR